MGVQLHPWVSPPHDEEVNVHNSFSGNLSPELERAKFRKLRDTIEQAFGVSPLIYRAGRYGVGPATASILSECGIAIDTSIRSRFDYSATGGPNFRDHPLRPWWIDRRNGLMEMPLTTVFWGPLRQQGQAIYPALWRTPRPALQGDVLADQAAQQQAGDVQRGRGFHVDPLVGGDSARVGRGVHGLAHCVRCTRCIGICQTFLSGAMVESGGYLRS